MLTSTSMFTKEDKKESLYTVTEFQGNVNFFFEKHVFRYQWNLYLLIIPKSPYPSILSYSIIISYGSPHYHITRGGKSILECQQ